MTANLTIDDRFHILPGSPLADLGGCPCFQANDQRGLAGEVVAIRTGLTAPPRPKLSGFMQARHEALLSPLAHGAAGGSYWIISSAPPGPSVASLVVPWSGNVLLTHVLRPVAQALELLQTNGLTHRAIRPDNLFIATASKSVVLGPGWATPPALSQPSVFEPPYSALCSPAARGDGSIADDVYALGVLLLALWTGQMPLAATEFRDIIQLKLEYGSHAALTGQLRLQRGFDEILRAMLSDDPLARPTPTALANLDAIHARRGGQRAVLCATRPIAMGERLAWNRRTLAVMCAEQPAEGLMLLKQGAIEHWLRRSAEDVALASDIEELRRDELLDNPRGATRSAAANTAAGPALAGRIDDVCLLRLVALLDPLLPLFWRGCWLWPDGLGPMLAASLQNPEAAIQPPGLDPREAWPLLEGLFWRGALARWRLARAGRPDPGGPNLAPRLLRRFDQDDNQFVFLRIAYALNPYLSCASPRLAGTIAINSAALVASVERLAGADAAAGKPSAAKPLLDPHMLAFLDARLEEQTASTPEPRKGDLEQALRELSVLARCQRMVNCGPLMRIAASLLPRLEPLLQDWPGLERREKRLALLRSISAAGDLAGMMELAGDVDKRAEDDAARKQAIARAAEIGISLAGQLRDAPLQLEASRTAARETAAAFGIMSIMGALLYELLS